MGLLKMIVIYSRRPHSVASCLRILEQSALMTAQGARAHSRTPAQRPLMTQIFHDKRTETIHFYNAKWDGSQMIQVSLTTSDGWMDGWSESNGPIILYRGHRTIYDCYIDVFARAQNARFERLYRATPAAGARATHVVVHGGRHGGRRCTVHAFNFPIHNVLA